MHPYLNTAITAARRAGKIITRNMENLEMLRIEEKGVNDFVTLVDRECENAIIDTLRKAYPHHSILGEETGFHAGDDFTWVIDPLDGTLNYIHGFPCFVVSIAAKLKEQVEHAVIYDPVTQDLYTASKGRGAQLNAKRIRVSDHHSLTGTLIGSSFPFMDREKDMDMHFNIFKTIFSQCADVRRTGSAALNLALIAAGRLDGVWESGLKPWDIAAGSLLVREAGGYMTDFEAGHNYFENGTIIAGSRKIHAEILKIIQDNKWW